MARTRGPSPLVPALMVGILSLTIFWPHANFIVGNVTTLFQAVSDAGDAGSITNFIMQMLLLFLMFLIRFLTASSPKSIYGRK